MLVESRVKFRSPQDISGNSQPHSILLKKLFWAFVFKCEEIHENKKCSRNVLRAFTFPQRSISTRLSTYLLNFHSYAIHYFSSHSPIYTYKSSLITAWHEYSSADESVLTHKRLQWKFVIFFTAFKVPVELSTLQIHWFFIKIVKYCKRFSLQSNECSTKCQDMIHVWF